MRTRVAALFLDALPTVTRRATFAPAALAASFAHRRSYDGGRAHLGLIMSAVQSEHNHLSDLIAAHQQRLGILRVQAAKQGDDTPAHITAEIARIGDELRELKQAVTSPVSAALMEE